MPHDRFNRLMLLLAGLLGAGGVAAAAASAHTGDALLQPLALIALTQAPALLAFGLVPVRGICLRAGALAIGGGAALFCADLAVRHILGPHLFPYAAPIGGTAMIAGWFAVAVGGLLHRAAR
jgi:uncharacterized membrane protein YgdD (TMEM256/DUF423 family)